MWPAAEYGRTMYTVKNRVGPLIVKLEKKNGESEITINIVFFLF